MSKALQIRLIKPSSESGGVSKPSPAETVTVACPDHLVLADLPVAKGVGPATSAVTIKTVGRRSRRQLGERVHFCVRCDFPIAIYGRLSPCEHAYCLDCARSDSICYLCDERIQKIQTIKLMEGIFICAAPHCLKSFLKRSEFETHIHESHADLLHPNAEKEDCLESEVQSMRQPTTSDSTVRGLPRPVISPGSNTQLLDSEDKACRQQTREQSLPRPLMQPPPPFFGQAQNYNSEPYADNAPPALPNHFQNSIQINPQPEPTQYSDKQQGVLSESSIPEYPPMNAMQPPNFLMPMNSNPLMTPQFAVPPFQPEGAQSFYGAPYEMAQMAGPNSAQEVGPEQGSLLGFPPRPLPGVNFMPNYPPPWNTEPASGSQGGPDGFGSLSDSQGNVACYQGDYGRNPGGLPMLPSHPASGNRAMELVQSSNPMELRDGKSISTLQPFSPPPPPPPPPTLSHLSQSRRAKYYSGDIGHDGQGFRWQHENRDSFGGGQD